METPHTNKTKLVSGLKTMLLSLVCMFIGPTGIYLALSNKDKSTYILILIIAFIISGLAIYFAFKGIKTILDSMFKK
jgi:hypothetical protein